MIRELSLKFRMIDRCWFIVNGKVQLGSPDSTNFKQTFNRCRWWFFKKLEVHDLKGDRERKKRSKAYWKARNPLLFSDDAADGPTIQWPDAEYRPHEWNPEQPTRLSRRTTGKRGLENGRYARP